MMNSKETEFTFNESVKLERAEAENTEMRRRIMGALEHLGTMTTARQGYFEKKLVNILEGVG